MKLIICFCLFNINFFCSFSQDNVFYVRNFGSKKNIDVPGNSKIEGEKIIQWSKNEGENQKWQLIKADDNSYYIKSVSSGLFLDVPGGSTQSGIEVIQWSFHGGVNQKWIFKEEYDKKYKIISKVSGKHLQIKSNTASDGDKIIQTDLTNDDYSLWELFDVSRKKANYYVAGTINDVDGNTYKTVTIGTQTWMAENLRVSKYNDGTPIPNVADNSKWSKLTKGARSYYNNDASYNVKYGKLYNWFVVNKTTNGNKNVCPTGWHVPTSAEWTILIDYLGGIDAAAGKMKEAGSENWLYNYGASNESLFNALPGGNRWGFNGTYSFINSEGYWWSSTETATNDRVTVIVLYNYQHNVDVKGTENKTDGCSIRCLKD